MSDTSPDGAEVAFSFLGDGLRLSILRALAARESRAGPREDPVPYSDLRRAVGERDSGKFGYHLGKLVGGFVERTDRGYLLREPGREAVRLLDRGVVDGEADVEPTRVDRRCPLCGGDVVVRYGDHHLVACCTDCAGLFGTDGCPDGTVTGVVLPPATVRDREVPDLFGHAHRLFERRLRAMFDGLCLECGGTVDRRVDRCPDHTRADGDVCGTCSVAYPALARLVCDVCGRGRVTHPLFGNPGADGVDAAGDDGGETAWERFGGFLSWRVADGPDPDATAFERPDGEARLVLDGDLRVVG